MLSSQRDPKSPYPRTLSEWLRLDYFLRKRPLRGARKWATLTAVVLSAACAGWTLLPANHSAHQAGPLSTAHAMFSNDCARCHTEHWQPLARLVAGDTVRSVSDQTCRGCHDGPLHHANQPERRACAECHREHRGNHELARVADNKCTSCHANLKEEAPRTILDDVKNFGQHPEFLKSRAGEVDRANLKFNHAAHLQLDLEALRAKSRQGLHGLGDRLECASCHEPDSARRYMKPIRYKEHCARCHPLTVQIAGTFQDPKTRAAAAVFAREPAPHEPPTVVRAVLRERLVQFVQDHPVVLGGLVEPPRPMPGRGPLPLSEAEARWLPGKLNLATEALFINQELPSAERGVLVGRCRQCHYDARPFENAGGLPEYLPTNVPSRWFTQSTFRHNSHRMLGCLVCHEKAATSTSTRDILMPAVASCQQCHHPQGGARSDCAECHSYHDRKLERGLNGSLTLDNFRGIR